jgi:hypothetical protein
MGIVAPRCRQSGSFEETFPTFPHGGRGKKLAMGAAVCQAELNHHQMHRMTKYAYGMVSMDMPRSMYIVYDDVYVYVGMYVCMYIRTYVYACRVVVIVCWHRARVPSFAGTKPAGRLKAANQGLGQLVGMARLFYSILFYFILHSSLGCLPCGRLASGRQA